MEGKVKIAMGQMLVEWGKPEENLSRARNMIREAAEIGCQVIVLPECMDLGWTYPAKELAQPIPGRFSDLLCELAREFTIFVVAGLTEQNGDSLYKAAVIVSDKGEVILQYRKINELDFALELYSIGMRVNATETNFGKVGLAICADLRTEHSPIGNSLGLMGTRFLLSPSVGWSSQIMIITLTHMVKNGLIPIVKLQRNIKWL